MNPTQPAKSASSQSRSGPLETAISSAGRLLDERDFHPPPLADGDTDAGFSQMPFDAQLPTQTGTQANLLPRFGAVVAPSTGAPAALCNALIPLPRTQFLPNC